MCRSGDNNGKITIRKKILLRFWQHKSAFQSFCDFIREDSGFILFFERCVLPTAVPKLLLVCANDAPTKLLAGANIHVIP